MYPGKGGLVVARSGLQVGLGKTIKQVETPTRPTTLLNKNSQEKNGTGATVENKEVSLCGRE